MRHIEAKVRSFVSDDPKMRGAIETVLDRSEDGEVQWIDVKTDLTSGQWGRLIEKGILIDGDEGFALADPEATHQALENSSSSGVNSSSSSSSVDDIEGTTGKKQPASKEDGHGQMWDYQGISRFQYRRKGTYGLHGDAHLQATKQFNSSFRGNLSKEVSKIANEEHYE